MGQSTPLTAKTLPKIGKKKETFWKKREKVGKMREKMGKRGKKSGKRGKIGKVLSLWPSWQRGLAALLKSAIIECNWKYWGGGGRKGYSLFWNPEHNSHADILMELAVGTSALVLGVFREDLFFENSSPLPIIEWGWSLTLCPCEISLPHFTRYPVYLWVKSLSTDLWCCPYLACDLSFGSV